MTTGWRERMRQVGKMAFIREEMVRLGYWPPDSQTASETAEVEAQLKELYQRLARLQTDLADVDAQITAATAVQEALKEIRRRRIERVRAERAARREQRVKDLAARRAKDAAWKRETLPYLGPGVSQGLHYADGDDAKLQSLGLPVLTTAADVAAAIGIETPALAWLTFHRGASAIDHYARFEIPKKRGGMRVISSPKRRLRVAQRWLLNTVLAPLPVHAAAMAFRPGVSVADNAAQHAGRAVVIRIDLKDFFPSVTLPRVRKLFRSFGYNNGVATLFALLATEAPRVAVTLDGARKFVAIGERVLPQGACTSPAITNLLCRGLDARLTGAAQKLGFIYTRYADDLVFSHEKPDAPAGMLLDLVRRIIADTGFRINEDKTAVMRPQHRQVVTGVVVNEQPHISRHDLRRFRAFQHRCRTRGYAAVSQELGKDARAYESGYLAYLHMVCPEQAQRFRVSSPGK